MTPPLTLKMALESNRLDKFIAQEEARGVGPIDRGELMKAIKATIKPPRSEDRTSHSRGRGCSTGK